MTEELKMVTTLDLKGLVCPIPIVKVSQAIKNVQVGEVIEAFATDRVFWVIYRPGAKLPVMNWSRWSAWKKSSALLSAGLNRIIQN